MFERFTDRARRVVVLSQGEARILGHNYMGTEHILLGLICEGEGVAAQALASLGISLEAAREKVETVIGRGKHVPSGHLPFTPRAEKVFELSLREALRLNHSYISTEHLLLGLIREVEGVAAQILVDLGADLDRVRSAVLQVLYPGSQTRSSSLRAALQAERAGLQKTAATTERRLAEIDEALSRLCPECDQTMRLAGEALVCEACGHAQVA